MGVIETRGPQRVAHLSRRTSGSGTTCRPSTRWWPTLAVRSFCTPWHARFATWSRCRTVRSSTTTSRRRCRDSRTLAGSLLCRSPPIPATSCPPLSAPFVAGSPTGCRPIDALAEVIALWAWSTRGVDVVGRQRVVKTRWRTGSPSSPPIIRATRRAFIDALLAIDSIFGDLFGDTRTEVLIQQAMTALRVDRTSFVIAHRLSTIHGADTIVVMDGGRIVEQGRHDELTERNGAYAALSRGTVLRPGHLTARATGVPVRLQPGDPAAVDQDRLARDPVAGAASTAAAARRRGPRAVRTSCPGSVRRSRLGTASPSAASA